MKDFSSSSLDPNVQQFSGFADIYDKYRPKMPIVVIDILTQLAQKTTPDLVVDLGCGTGLSTRTWIGHAKSIIGVEPNDDLRLKAESISKDSHSITYQKGTATSTDMADKSADIITICQTIGWVEPKTTFNEVSRILKPHGIFAAVDYDVPGTTTLEIFTLERNFQEHARELIIKHDLNLQRQRWDKKQYINEMKASGVFKLTHELAVSGKEDATVERIIGFNLSHAETQILLQHGLSEEEIGLSTLRKQLQNILGERSIPMYMTYKLRIGQK